jgi:hypothetical protein
MLCVENQRVIIGTILLVRNSLRWRDVPESF